MESEATQSNNSIPAPPPIILPGPTLELMNKYVKGFSPQHGYHISIGRSSVQKKQRSKDPTKESKSLKINCPFTLKARYNSTDQTWTVVHVNITHNHQPNADIKLQSTNTPQILTLPTSQPSTASHNDLNAELALRTLGCADIQPKSPTCELTPSSTSEPTVNSFIKICHSRLLGMTVEHQKELMHQIDSLFRQIHTSEPNTAIDIDTNNKQVNNAEDTPTRQFVGPPNHPSPLVGSKSESDKHIYVLSRIP
ncbi:uncharacterized protein MELLADRAFT_67715 [Melampsora larici-populina 98AG31]|uniref:FAR1 domain-containing protein n=1 Tax=Melampsora larici-populina (strain 98AG31 / pathotype 3-4-7) TaxID=747676 RepID=F4S4B7_MELLP|nr:uncharacterized protein MELLADRAFT_67715 [Melampsora larici-populina 98AG31]EGG00496.1 hypothetical protein MELLADRAFT_67715 [Melampsora larici-populina 98AG31]